MSQVWLKAGILSQNSERVCLPPVRAYLERGELMPTVYLRQDLYDEILRRREEVTSFVNKVVEEALWKKELTEKKPEPLLEKPRAQKKKK